MIEPPCTDRYARWCGRSAVNHRLLPDSRVEEGLERGRSVKNCGGRRIRFARCKIQMKNGDSPFLFEFHITVRREADPLVTEDRARNPLQKENHPIGWFFFL